MNITQLQYFHAVCTYKTVSAAADILHISQPSVSAAIYHQKHRKKRRCGGLSFQRACAGGWRTCSIANRNAAGNKREPCMEKRILLYRGYEVLSELY